MPKPIKDQQVIDHIAEYATKAMEKLGWTQARLAAETGEKEMQISRVLSGQYITNCGTLARIAQALGLEPGELFPAMGPKKRVKKSA